MTTCSPHASERRTCEGERVCKPYAASLHWFLGSATETWSEAGRVMWTPRAQSSRLRHSRPFGCRLGRQAPLCSLQRSSTVCARAYLMIWIGRHQRPWELWGGRQGLVLMVEEGCKQQGLHQGVIICIKVFQAWLPMLRRRGRRGTIYRCWQRYPHVPVSERRTWPVMRKSAAGLMVVHASSSSSDCWLHIFVCQQIDLLMNAAGLMVAHVCLSTD